MIAYISIGNSDDKLTQKRWSDYVRRVDSFLAAYGKFHGNWRSLPDDPFQNACWCVEFTDTPSYTAQQWAEQTKVHLRNLAGLFEQDSIAWMTGETEFLTPESYRDKNAREDRG